MKVMPARVKSSPADSSSLRSTSARFKFEVPREALVLSVVRLGSFSCQPILNASRPVFLFSRPLYPPQLVIGDDGVRHCF